MAIVDNLPSSPGGGPGASAVGSEPIVDLLRMTYENTMLVEMQMMESIGTRAAARQTELRGYEKRIDRWSKTAVQQRARAGFLGDDVTGGVQSAETPTRTVVIRGEHWEHPEFFDLRDDVGTDGFLSAMIPGGPYQQNVMAAMEQKADSIFFNATNGLDGTVQLGDGGGAATNNIVTVSHLVGNDGVDASVATAFNVGKAIALITTLHNNNAFRRGDMWVALKPTQLRQVLNDPLNRITSADFNSLQPLMTGEVQNFLGARWILSTEIPAVADADPTSGGSQAGAKVYAWNSMAVTWGRGRETTWTKDVASRGETVLVYSGAFFGVVRTDDLGVTTTLCPDATGTPYT